MADSYITTGRVPFAHLRELSFMKLLHRCSLGLIAGLAVLSCSDSTAPKSSIPPANLPLLGEMSVGDVRTMTFAQAQSGLSIPADKSSAVYLIVTANVTPDTGGIMTATVSGNKVAPQTLAQLAPQSSSTLPFMRPVYTRIGGTRGGQFEAQVRSYERTHLRFPLNRSKSTMSAGLRRGDNVPYGTVPTVGQQFQFNVPGSGDNLCTSYNARTATVEAVTQHAIIVVDNRALNNGFTTASYDSIGAEFDNYVYPTEVGYYGAPTDIDNNQHVFILYTPDVNTLTPPGTAQTQGFVGGYTFAGDFFPTSECAESNLAEIFYLMVPDATGSKWGNAFPTSFVEEQTRSTMAHELQHAINSGNRIQNGASNLESAWLDEALSSLAEDNVGRAELGYSDLQTLSASTVLSMDTTMLNTYFISNFERTLLYVLRPDTVGAFVSDDREESDLAAFGAGWALLRYTADWFSNSNPRTLTKALVAGPDTGTSNLATQAKAPLDTILAHWLVTMYTDGQNIPGLAAQYNYRSYNLRNILSYLCPPTGCDDSSGPTYLLPVTPIGNGSTSVTVTIPTSSANYFITSESTGGARTIKVLNSDGSAATNPYGRVYVVRVQ